MVDQDTIDITPTPGGLYASALMFADDIAKSSRKDRRASVRHLLAAILDIHRDLELSQPPLAGRLRLVLRQWADRDSATAYPIPPTGKEKP